MHENLKINLLIYCTSLTVSGYNLLIYCTSLKISGYKFERNPFLKNNFISIRNGIFDVAANE